MKITRAKSLKNITRERVRVTFVSGMSANLLPGCTIEDVAITNADEIKSKILIVGDLTEVVGESGKIRLDS